MTKQLRCDVRSQEISRLSIDWCNFWAKRVCLRFCSG